MIETVHQILRAFWGTRQYTLKPLAGDAGNRIYYRSENNGKCIVVMDRNESYSPESDPFIQLTHYLSRNGVPVPGIIKDCSEDGILLIDDLGDVTLQSAYIDNPSQTREQLYQKVLEVLIRMHTVCKQNSSDCKVQWYKQRFDYNKLHWELDFFLKYYISDYRKIVLKSSQIQIIRTAFDFICSKLAEETTVFTHRDFHSRNIMVKNRNVYLIDYQDARLGRPEYDLASLFRDAYIVLPESFIESGLDNYYKQTNDNRNWETRRYIFSLMCLQRNLKALGTFGFQAAAKNNSIYLQYIPNLKHHINRELDLLNSVFKTHSGLPATFGPLLNEVII